jgi:hypothetical protein
MLTRVPEGWALDEGSPDLVGHRPPAVRRQRLTTRPKRAAGERLKELSPSSAPGPGRCRDTGIDLGGDAAPIFSGLIEHDDE